jgi:hypothetical protein
MNNTSANKIRLENPMLPAAKGQIVWKVSRTPAAGFRHLPKVSCKCAARFRQLPMFPCSLHEGIGNCRKFPATCDKVSALAESTNQFYPLI